MFMHNVYFWLVIDLDDEAITAFEGGLETLCQNPPVKSGYYGRPADTHRDVVVNNYSYGMVLIFDDKAGQDAYQIGEVHQRFVAQHMDKWERVVVYDIQTQ